MNILLDMDGVLVDFMGGACAAWEKPNPYVYGQRGSYDICGELGIHPNIFWSKLTFTFWANLKPLPWAKELVITLENAFGRDNICILTSPCGTFGCADGKISWLTKHFPEYRRRVLVGPPKHFCASPGSLLIDDYEKNIESFREHGGSAFLFAAPWNSKWRDVNPMPEFRHMVKELRRGL